MFKHKCKSWPSPVILMFHGIAVSLVLNGIYLWETTNSRAQQAQHRLLWLTVAANILVYFKNADSWPETPIDRKGLNLTIKAYKRHQNDLAYRRHLSMSKINIYVCTALCRNQKWDMKITIHGGKKEANSVRITLLRGSLWKNKKAICFNNWSQHNHKSSLLNHDLISKIKGSKQQFLWPPPPSLLLVVALFFMNSSSSLFRVAVSQTRPPLKLHSIFLPSWLLQLLQLGSQILNDKKSYPRLDSYTSGMHPHSKGISVGKSVPSVPLAPPQR